MATTTSSVAQSAPETTAVPISTPADLAAELGAAWVAGNEARLIVLVPSSASELLDWGQPEFVNVVSSSDCSLASVGTGSCELLVGIDGFGLLFQMTFSRESAGELRIDQVTFAGDAG